MAISERSVYMNRYSGSSVKVLTVVAAFGALPAFADSSLLVEDVEVVEGSEAFEGFSLGLDALYSHVSVDRDAFEMQVGNANSGKINGKWSHGRCRVDPSLNLGYARVINNWYMGVAADIAFGSNQKGEFKVKVPNRDVPLPFSSSINGMSYGIKAKGGYYFPKLRSVVYGFAGVKWREIDFRVDSSDGTVTKARLSSPAFLVGAGVERKLCKKFTVSAEYEYSWRNSNDTSAIKVSGEDVFATADQKLRGHAVKVGVKYHF